MRRQLHIYTEEIFRLVRPIKRGHADVFQDLRAQNDRKLTFVRRLSIYDVTHILRRNTERKFRPNENGMYDSCIFIKEKNMMKKAEKVKAILDRLDEHYSVNIKCYLHYKEPWQLLFSTIMSAQCTDARVNAVSEVLFKKYPNLSDFTKISQEELENEIRSTGFYHNKAKNIIACAKVLCEQYEGEVPSDIDELVKLPGVGRKTANVIRGEIFGIPSIVVDTHVGRIARKLGWSKSEDPKKVEFDLMKLLPEDHWILINLQLIAHGRAVCISRKPKCGECFLAEFCPSFKKDA